MFDWDSVEVWTKRILSRNHYRFRHWDTDDLVQEARIVFWKTASRYTDAQVLEFAREPANSPRAERAIARSRMAYYQRALMNRINSIAALAATRVAQATVGADEAVIDHLQRKRSQKCSYIEALELSLDLQRSPHVLAILEHSSWENGCRRSRKRRVDRATGLPETGPDVLARLGKLTAGRLAAAELADLTGHSF